MKCVATYPSYEEANERQLDLLAAEVDSLVEYVPTGFDQVYYGANPIYALTVSDDQVDQAIEIIRLIPDEHHLCLYRCPNCQSHHIKELRLDEGFGTGWLSLPMTLGIVAAVRWLRVRRLGRKYLCCDCGTEYRKAP